MYKFFHFFLVLCIVLNLGACAKPKKTQNSEVLLRANPGHTNWLERQAVLGMSTSLSKIVSGSNLPWRNSAQASSVLPILKAADIWLYIQPQTLITSDNQAIFAELNNSMFLSTLKKAGINGMYLAPALDAGSVWSKNEQTQAVWNDAISLNFAEYVGNDDMFFKLKDAAERQNIFIGSDLLPANPGLGPDFILAAQGVGEYPGAWIMVEVPQKLWALLPPSQKEGSTNISSELNQTNLSIEQITSLAKENIIPLKLARDHITNLVPANGSWAVTDIIRGQDGNLRRWVYRFNGDNSRPVLNFEDPSSAARRMFSASIIRQVGMLQQPLSGLWAEPLFGLDRLTKEDENTYIDSQNNCTSAAQPGPGAITFLSREIRRYGGWSLEREALPIWSISAFLKAGADFVMDSVSSPASEYALLSGNMAPLRNSLDEALSLNIDFTRLCRVLSSQDGLNLDLLPANGQVKPIASYIPSVWQDKFNLDSKLYIPAPALAAMRLNVDPDKLNSEKSEILKLHSLLLTWQAGLPGLLFISGQDLAGTTHKKIAQSGKNELLPAWSIESSASSTRNGFGRGHNAYAKITEQGLKPESFVNTLGKVSNLRKNYAISSARLLKRIKTGDGVAVLLENEQKDKIIVFANFSSKALEQKFTLEGMAKAESLFKNGDIIVDGASFKINMPPYSCEWILLKK